MAGPAGWLSGDPTSQDLAEAGFGDAGTADTMPPGPVLATLVDAAVRDPAAVAALSDDELVGLVAAARRTEARAAWAQIAAVAAFAARRPDPGRSAGRFGADELAGRLNLTWQSAAGQLGYAEQVTRRLPRSLAALAAGLIDAFHLRIIEDEASVLSDEDAATADEQLAGLAPSMTFGQLRYAAHRLVLTLDPDSARRRRERGRQDAEVRRFREHSGNAGLIARELPSDEVLASWQHVEQRAAELRAADVPGTLQDLRVRAYLDLLQERDTRTTHPQPSPESGPDPDPGAGGDGDSDGGPGGNGGPSLAALVTITVPLATLQGRSQTPGDAAGFGLLDAVTAREVVVAAARHPRTRWCLTVLHPDGTAAHGCATGPHPAPPSLSSFRLNVITRSPCDHARTQHRYRPGRVLKHLVTARNNHCTAPGCNQPAAACDLDHTTPWHHGGLTCECNLAPPCKR